MKCSRIRKQLNAYAANQISGELAGRIASHLERCPGCRVHLGEMRAVSEFLKQWTAPAPSPDLDRRTLLRVREAAAGARQPIFPINFSSLWSVSPLRLGLLASASIVIFITMVSLSPFWSARQPTINLAALPVTEDLPRELGVMDAPPVSIDEMLTADDLDWLDQMILRRERQAPAAPVMTASTAADMNAENGRVMHLLDLSSGHVQLVSHVNIGAY